MAIQMHTETRIPSEKARDVVIPLVREWFNLPEEANISVDMDLEIVGNGSGLLEIRLVKLIDPDQVLTLQANAQAH